MSVSDKNHIENYGSQIVTDHGYKSTWILCVIKKLSKHPDPSTCPRIFQILVLKIKFLEREGIGTKNARKTLLKRSSLSFTARLSQFNLRDGPQTKLKRHLEIFGFWWFCHVFEIFMDGRAKKLAYVLDKNNFGNLIIKFLRKLI